MSQQDEGWELLSARMRTIAQDRVAAFNRSYLKPTPSKYVLNMLSGYTDSINDNYSISAVSEQDLPGQEAILPTNHKKQIVSRGEHERITARISKCLWELEGASDVQDAVEAFRSFNVALLFRRLSVESFLCEKPLMSLRFYEADGMIVAKVYAGGKVIGLGPLMHDHEGLIDGSTQGNVWSFLALLALRVRRNT